ncbi:MAG: hypothetical protein QG673_2132 [Pseudomonadota bacterium]|nr:hypothetical protein [Pseudomonadota bacterium]
MQVKDVFKLPATILFILGIVDLIRGFMHTFVLNWSAANVAKLNVANTASDQIFLLGVFGISNFLTGTIYILISRKARELSPYILLIIPLTYLFGLIGIWSNHVHAKSAFEGQYFMYGYFAICTITFCIFLFTRQCSFNKSSLLQSKGDIHNE